MVSLAFVAIFVVTYMHGAAPTPGSAAKAKVAEAHLASEVASSAPPLRTTDVVPRARLPAPLAAGEGGRFVICHTGGGTNCVVDGDTVWVEGDKIRIADIDAPETHPPRCASEAELGERATRRLAELMNAGAFDMETPDRDTDRYGRRLRVLVRDGRSLGAQLVSEGLARPWEGRRRPWC